MSASQNDNGSVPTDEEMSQGGMMEMMKLFFKQQQALNIKVDKLVKEKETPSERIDKKVKNSRQSDYRLSN